MDRNLRIRMLLEAGDRASRPLRDIAGGGTAAARALKGTRDRLDEIKRARIDVAAFRKLKTGVRDTERALAAAQARVTALGRANAQAGAPTRAMTRDFDRARTAAERLARQHGDEQRQLGDLRTRLREAGVETTALARHDRELRDAAARTGVELEQQTARVGRLADRQRRMVAAREGFGRAQQVAGGMAASGAAAVGTGVAIGAGIWRGVEGAQAFESTMTDIGQKADLSRVKTAQLGRELLGAAKAANQMPDAMQAGVDTLTGFGLAPAKAVAMMRPIGRAATAYKAEIADLSAAAFAATDNLKVPIEQTGKLIDVAATAGKMGAFEIKDMAGALPSLTAGYQALGQSGVGAFADLTAALQIARKGTGDSASAATNLENVIQKIGSPATIRAFKKMGVDLPAAMKRAYAEGKTPLEAIAELTAKTTKGDLGKIAFLFEDAQVQQGLRPLIQNMDEYRRIRSAAFAASGTTDRDFAERMQDSAEQTKALRLNAQLLAINLGSMLLPTVNAVTSRVARFAGWIGAAAQRHPRLAKAAGLVGIILSGLFLIFGLGAIALAGIMGPIAICNAGLVAMGVSGGIASAGLLPILGTVALVVGAIALLAGAAYLIYRNWGAITGFFAGIWAHIRASVTGNLAYMAALPSRFVTFGRDMIGGLIRGILGMLGQLKATIVGAAGAAAAWFKQKLGIRSPSRVFMGLGGHVMGGLDRGLADGAAAPLARVRRVAGHLTAAMAASAAATPAIALDLRGADAREALSRGAAARSEFRTAERAATRPRAAPVAQRPAEYHFHITQAPGQSPEDLAQAIRDQIERLDRRARADARASYRDDPDGEDV